jgi:hypothetical protein
MHLSMEVQRTARVWISSRNTAMSLGYEAKGQAERSSSYMARRMLGGSDDTGLLNSGSGK